MSECNTVYLQARTVLSDNKLRSEYDLQLACNSLR